MAKKMNRNDRGLVGAGPGADGAGARPGRAKAPGNGGSAAATIAGRRGDMVFLDDPGPIFPFPPPKLEVRSALFELYVARVATIDRYRVPITDRGLPATFRKAFDEAKVALEVFQEKTGEVKSHE